MKSSVRSTSSIISESRERRRDLKSKSRKMRDLPATDIALGTTSHDAFNLRELETAAGLDPFAFIKACRARVQRYRKGIRELNWQAIAACYVAAQQFKKKPRAVARLLADGVLKDRKYKTKERDLLRLSLLVGMGAGTSGLLYKRACRQAKILQPFFDRGVSAEKVLQRIESAGGLKQLAAKASMSKGKPSEPTAEDSISARGEAADPSKLEGRTLPNEEMVKALPQPFVLEFETDDENGCTILDAIRRGRTCRIVLEHLPSEGKWIRIVAGIVEFPDDED